MTRVTQRVGRELRDRLSEILSLRVSDPRLKDVSILEVRPSPDLSFARVFYRTLGDTAEVEQALDKAKPFIRRCLAEGSRFRRVPELALQLDPTLASGEKMEKILRDLAVERQERSERTEMGSEETEDAEGSG